jgi:hypothetical protein
VPVIAQRLAVILVAAGAVAFTGPARAQEKPRINARAARAIIDAARPRLAFAAPTRSGRGANLGATSRDIDRSALTLSLTWAPTAATPTDVTWQWQVSLQPFDEDPTRAMSQPGLLSFGPATLDGRGVFEIDLRHFPPLGSRQPLPRDMPLDFYIRIIPLRDGKPLPLHSNTVIAHYKGGAAPDGQEDAPTRRGPSELRVPDLVGAARPRLAFALFTPNDNDATLGASSRDVYRSALKVGLTWMPTAVTPKNLTWRWQVSLQPFADDPSSMPSPPGLLASGPADLDQKNWFEIDLGSFPPLGPRRARLDRPVESDAVRNTGPGHSRAVDPRTFGAAGTRSQGGRLRQLGTPLLGDVPLVFHIRIIPLQDGKPSAFYSNTVTAHYNPGANPAQEAADNAAGKGSAQQSKFASMQAEARGAYQLAIVKFEPMVFADPNRWACIVVVKNPYFVSENPLAYVAVPHKLARYKPGKEYCPEPYTGPGNQVTLGTVLGGWVKAYGIMADFYSDAKEWVANSIADTLVPCPMLGKEAGEECKKAARSLANSALSAGLVYLGVPPSLPSLADLDDAGKGKLADAAADYTCDQIESNGGNCTPEMRAKLAEVYRAAIDDMEKNLRRAAHEPGCGDTQAANENGAEAPLPCFSDYAGAEVKPAKGSVQEPARVTVRVRRVKSNLSFALPPCRVGATLYLENQFPGNTYVHGVHYKDPQKLSAPPFVSAVAHLPQMSAGETRDVTVSFTTLEPFHLKGNYGGPVWYDDWLYLYQGGHGPLHASLSTATAVPGAQRPLECSEGAETQVQIPHP